MATSHPKRTPLSSYQRRGFWAAWGGWALDGMDSFIYALVLTPAVTDLLPRSGIEATAANIGYYGSLLLALFMIGWGLSMAWGPLADRFGRIRTLMLTIACYSLFTFLGAFVTNVWQLGACRLLAGIGIGGEWSMGGTYVAEAWPEHRRAEGAGYMHSGYYFGFFLAAIANFSIGAHHGWRWMFALGGLPALLVGFIRYGVREPERWEKRAAAHQYPTMYAAFAALFSKRYARRTLLNSLFLLISVVGLWAGSVYVPTSVMQLASGAGYTAQEAAKLASYGTMVLSVGTILGCLALPLLAERAGRRATLGIFFLLMFFSIAIGFGYVFYLSTNALAWFFVVLFFLGLGGANFAIYTLWLPEQYDTSCRASAFAFTTSVGRFAGAGITFLVGNAVARYGSLGTPIALTSLAFLVGLFLLPLGEETKGRALPS
ncbi:MAG: MFS transporter [Acidobacteriaceae bacterium]|jgi:MFS family permease|nr:MFS transporter [Acidobacteriaceae bacterium]